MRLDKFLANAGIGTRKEVKKFVKQNLVTVNDELVKKPDIHINPEEDIVVFDEIPIEYEPVVYLMMNKPAGFISATEDDEHETVIDIVPEYMHMDLFPVGRLDKDTEGLLLLTNDGKFSHQLMNPKHKVPKKYYVEVDGHIKEEAIGIFKNGIDLGDFTSYPSELEIIEDDVTALFHVDKFGANRISIGHHRIAAILVLVKTVVGVTCFYHSGINDTNVISSCVL